MDRTLPEDKRKKSLDRINELVAWWVLKIKSSIAMGLLDNNLISEDILVDIFREVYGYEKLANLNVAGGRDGDWWSKSLNRRRRSVCRARFFSCPSGQVIKLVLQPANIV